MQNYKTRPRLKITLSRFDKTLEVISIILLISLWIITLINYVQSPERVAVHFNLSGVPDRYGQKLILYIVPVISTVIYFALTQLGKYPQVYNYMIKITEENARRQYTIAVRMIRILKTSVVLIFAIDALASVLITFGIFRGLGYWFFPLVVLLLAVPLVYAIFESLNKKTC